MPLNLPWIFCLSKKETLMNEETQLGLSQLRFFGKSLLKLAQKSKKEIEVMIGRKTFVIAFSNIK